MPKGFIYDGYNSSEPFEPIATNGQPFPWLLPYLPTSIRPNRYTLTIHPNLTTLEVKGKARSTQLFISVLCHSSVPRHLIFPAFCRSSGWMQVTRTLTYAFNVIFSYFHFTGQISIEFYVEKEVNFIVLHAQNLNITEKVSAKGERGG